MQGKKFDQFLAATHEQMGIYRDYTNYDGNVINGDMKEHINQTSASFERLNELLIRIDERLANIATKDDLNRVELKVARLEGENEAIKSEIRGLSDTLAAKIDGSNKEIKAELKSKIGWGGVLSIIGTLAVLIPAVLWLLQTFLK